MPSHARARLLVPALALAATLGTAATAQAVTPRPTTAQSAASVTFTIPAGVTTVSVDVGGVHASVRKTDAERPETINCTVTANRPFEYYGGTYGGGEEGIANTTCSAVVYEIQTTAALFLNGTSSNNEVSYGTYTVYQQSSGSADAIYPLQAGTYYTAGQTTVTFVYGQGSSTSGIAYSSGVYLP